MALADQRAGLAAVVEEQLGGGLVAGTGEPLPDQEPADVDAGGRRAVGPPLAGGLPVLATLARCRRRGAVGRVDHGEHRCLRLLAGDGGRQRRHVAAHHGDGRSQLGGNEAQVAMLVAVEGDLASSGPVGEGAGGHAQPSGDLVGGSQ